MVWGVKNNRQLFYCVDFIVVSDRQSLKTLESLNTKLTEYRDGLIF